MNAIELTKKSNEQDAKLIDHNKRIEYLEQELAKLRLIIEDMKIDVQMMERR